MTKPSKREAAQILKIERLSTEDTQTLLQVLTVLGFDFETIALMWGKDIKNATVLFKRAQLSGSDLVHFCTYVRVRPGVIQRKLNFDESPLRRTKHGFKSRMKVQPWIGPPELCLSGAAAEGRAFREIYSLPAVGGALAPESQLQREVLNQIAKGSYPVPLHVLRDVVLAWQKTGIEHPKGKILEDVLSGFPADVQSVEDIFAPAETEITHTTEESMGGAMKQFIEHCKGNQVGPAVHCLVTTLGLERWVEEQWQWDEKRLSLLKANAEGVPKYTLQELMGQLSGQTIPDEAKDAYQHLQGFVRGKADKDSSTGFQMAQLPSKVVGRHGETWFPHKKKVRIAGKTFCVTGEDEKSLPRRIFSTLNQLRLQRNNENWTAFNAEIGITRETALAFSQGTWVGDADRVEFLLAAIKRGIGIDLSLEQLCGIKPLVLEERIEPSGWLFEPGDVRTATSWIFTLRKYRAVYARFRKEYGLTRQHEEEILAATRRVPLAVHRYLLYLIEQRLVGVKKPVLPRAYTALLQMPESKFDRRELAEHTQPPLQNWLTS